MELRKYQVTILVDIEAVTEAYISNNELEEEDELPDLEDMVRNPFNWIREDGISLIGDLVEITEE